MSATSLQVNPRVLLWARESLGLNKTAASERLGVGLAQLVAWESGDVQPGVAELRAMAKAYKQTLATLLLYEPPAELPLPTDFRTINSDEVGGFSEKTIQAVRKARAMATSWVELRQEFGLPIGQVPLQASLANDPGQIAFKIRELLGIQQLKGAGTDIWALEWSIERLEMWGIAVFQMNLTADDIRGFCMTDAAAPTIVVKRSEPTSGKLFTLFHELGHILLRQVGICDLASNNQRPIEQWCNSFAATLLVPSDELLCHPIIQEQYELRNMHWRKVDLESIASQFHVGKLVILRRLLDLGRTNQQFYHSKHDSWNKPTFGRGIGKGRNIPKETVQEKGKSYVQLAFKAFDQNRINLKDLSDFLGVKLKYLSKTREYLNV
ncbi:MAG: ImmA/IrrE family metallo-endopeptidase [Bacteroidia bacterium]